jgi:hypothetical protein
MLAFVPPVVGFGHSEPPEPRRPSRQDKGLRFDPFDTYKGDVPLSVCLRMGSFGWIVYLILAAIRANIEYWFERRRRK